MKLPSFETESWAEPKDIFQATKSYPILLKQQPNHFTVNVVLLKQPEILPLYLDYLWCYQEVKKSPNLVTLTMTDCNIFNWFSHFINCSNSNSRLSNSCLEAPLGCSYWKLNNDFYNQLSKCNRENVGHMEREKK